MLYLALVLLTALLLGMRHATDADHVIAVSTIVSREGSVSRAASVGVLWGLGHTLTIMLVGGAMVLFDVVMPPRVSTIFEGGVAVMLLVLGARSLWGARARGTHPPLPMPPFAVGIVHGLAGSAAAALLVVPLIQSPRLAALYLVVFGAGTIAGMTLLTCALAGSALYATRRAMGLDRWIRLGAGLTSVGFGAVLLYRIA